MWPAMLRSELRTVETVRPATLVAGELCVPGDKSIAHRALMLSSIADGESTVRGLPDGDDVRATMACLRAVGVRIASSYAVPAKSERWPGQRLYRDAANRCWAGQGILDAARDARLCQLGHDNAFTAGPARREPHRRHARRRCLAAAASHGSGDRAAACDGRARPVQ